MMRFPGESRGEMNGVGDVHFIKVPFFPEFLRSGEERAGERSEKASFYFPSRQLS